MIQKTYFKTKDTCKVKFSIAVENAQSIEVMGLNDDWEIGLALTKKKDGSFSGEVALPKDAQYQFKYRINSTEWINDPAADSQVPDSFGGTNSVISL